MKKNNLHFIFYLTIYSFLIANTLSAQPWKEQDSIAYENFKIKNYDKAEQSFLQCLKIIDSIKGNNCREYAAEIGTLANFYFSLRQTDKADSLFGISIDMFKNLGDTLNIEYADILNDLGDMYLENSYLSYAEPLYLTALEVKKQVTGINSASYTFTLNQLGVLYRRTGQYLKAENCYNEALSIDKGIFGIISSDIAIDYNNLGALYKELGQYDKSEKMFITALNIIKAASGENSVDYALKLSNLGELYYTIGQYKKAEEIQLSALNIYTRIAKNSVDYSNVINNLANIYMDMGIYDKAERLCKQVREIKKAFYGNKHPEYANSLETLARLYTYMGEYEKEEKLLNESLDIKKNSLGEKNPDYARSLNNLAGVYRKTGRLDKAESYYLKSLEIRKEVFGVNHLTCATALNNLGVFYKETNKYSLAEKYCIDALKVIEKIMGTDNQYYIITLENLACIYDLTGKYEMAEKYHNIAMEYYKANYGEKHTEYTGVINNLAALYMNMNKFESAGELFKKSNDNLLFEIKNYYPSLSEKEKMSFLNKIYNKFERFYSFAIKYYLQDESISEDLLNLRIATKGMVLSTTSQVRNRILNSNDSALIDLYNQLVLLRSEINKGYAFTIDERIKNGKDISELENKANETEKLLTSLSELYSPESGNQNIRYKDIQAKLENTQCAIEILDFRLFDKNWTDKTEYYAIIVSKEFKYPKLIRLCSEDDLKKLLVHPAESNKGYLRNNDVNIELYGYIWKPVEPFIKNVKQIYISPSGLLNKVSFYALLNENNELLCDKYSLHYVGNIKDILMPDPSSKIKDNLKFVLFGGALFDLDSTDMYDILKKYYPDNNDYFIPGESNTKKLLTRKWDFLPGTLEETENIKSMFESKNIPAYEFKGKDACEEAFKSLNGKNSPFLIHIATHGYFFPPPDKEKYVDSSENKKNKFQLSENPFMRSGLIFSGANRVWTGEEEIEGLENGILTASEISNMDLVNTNLVVLSACETGLGDIKGGEGVYGLQRAFKVAGAKTVIMSLWKVPDKETVELMDLFYNNWINGMTKHEAFSTAQKEMRKKYSPYYWAAFVMVE